MERQSLRAASQLPAELSASIRAGATLLAMMDSDPLSVVSARLDELGGVLVGKRQTAIAGIPVLPAKEHMLPPQHGTMLRCKFLLFRVHHGATN